MDDNPADLDLTRDVLGKSKVRFHVSTAGDGEEAMEFLRGQGKYAAARRPDIILLDLNLPRKDGREVLKEIRSDAALARIPVVVFTTSQASSDVNGSYDLGANCYLRKPGNLADFTRVVQSMADFWLNFASLPHKEKQR